MKEEILLKFCKAKEPTFQWVLFRKTPTQKYPNTYIQSFSTQAQAIEYFSKHYPTAQLTILLTENMETGNSRREAIIEEVKKCVLLDRQQSYGDAEDNFENIRNLWNIYTKTRWPGEAVVFESYDVAAFMAFVKLARSASSPTHLDNWIDLAGYAVCGGGIISKETKK